MNAQEMEAWRRAEEALLHPRDLGNNGKTVSGAGPSTPGPKLTPRRATGDARARKG